MTVADNMKLAVRRLQRGMCTIEECERELDAIIADATPNYSDIDRRLAVQKKLKRKAWRMLLEATRRAG